MKKNSFSVIDTKRTAERIKCMMEWKHFRPRDIQEYLGQKQHEIQDTLSVTANYFLGNTEDYLVCCQVREKNATLIDLTISVPSEKQAISVCNHWKSKSQEIYAHVMEQLL